MPATRDSASALDLRTASARELVEEALGSSLRNGTDDGRLRAHAGLRAPRHWDFTASAGIRSGQRPPADLADASFHADAWRRVARDLPAHLENDRQPGFGGHPRCWNEAIIRGSGVFASVVAAVGITDAGLHRLRPFDGLKEGFAQIA